MQPARQKAKSRWKVAVRYWGKFRMRRVSDPNDPEGHPARFAIQRYKTLVAPGLLTIGLLCTGVAVNVVKQQAETDALLDFSFACDEVQQNITTRLRACEQVLRSGAALFQASAAIDREELGVFVAGLRLEQHLPGVQGVGFSKVIPREQLAAHEEAIRREGFPDYQVRPVGEREVYSSIIYLEPFTDRNLRAFGYDMFSEPVRRLAMERARDSQMAALSGKVILVQETDRQVQAGTLMYYPVYTRGMPLGSLEERRRALRGWVYSPYRMTDLLNGALGGWLQLLKERQIGVEVYEGYVPAVEQRLYAHGPTPAPPETSSDYHQMRAIDFAGHRWTLRFTQYGGLAATANYGSTWLTLFGGSAVSLLVFGLALSLQRTGVQAEQRAAQLTHELRQTTERLALATRSGGVGVWDYDVRHNRLIWDEQMCRLHGLGADPFGEGLEAWRARVHPEDKARFDQEIRQALDNVAGYNTEFRVLWPDGSMHHIRAFGVVERDAEGRPMRMVGTNWDITASKEAERTLRATQSRLALAMDLALLVHWEMEAASGQFIFNDAFYALYGTTAGREGGYRMAVETYAREFVAADERHLVGSNAALLLEGKAKEVRLEHRIVRRDGEHRTIAVNAVAVHDAHGRIIGMRGANQDVTELRRIERSLQESEEKFNAFMQAMPAAAFIKDEAGRYLFINDSLGQMFGVSRESAQGRTSADFLAPAESAALDAHEAQVRTSLRPLLAEQTLTIRGEEQIFLTSSFPIPRPGGSAPLVGGVAVEITERRRSELALQRSEERFRSVVQAMSEGLVVTQADGRIVECNEQAERILGVARADLLGQPAAEVALGQAVREDGTPWEAALHPVMLGLRTGERATHRVLGLHSPARGLRWINLNAEPMTHPGESTPYALVITFNDITERIEQQKNVEALLGQTESDARTKGVLLREVNHRVTNNLSSILGLFAGERRALEASSRASVEPVLQRLTQRIHGLLAAHRLLSEAQWTPLRLDKLADRIIQAALSADPSRQRAQVQIDSGQIEVSPRQAASLALVLNELTTNSIKHCPPGTPLLALRLEARAAEGDVELIYRDNGAGFPAAILSGEAGNIGHRLLHQLVTGSLQGSLTLRNDAGAVVVMRFPTEDLRLT